MKQMSTDVCSMCLTAIRRASVPKTCTCWSGSPLYWEAERWSQVRTTLLIIHEMTSIFSNIYQCCVFFNFLFVWQLSLKVKHKVCYWTSNIQLLKNRLVKPTISHRRAPTLCCWHTDVIDRPWSHCCPIRMHQCLVWPTLLVHYWPAWKNKVTPTFLTGCGL